MQWFIAVVVVAILGVAAMAAAGGMGEMAPDPGSDTFRQDLPDDRPLSAADLQQLRFGVALRGYSMRQVDDLLDRLTREIADRDAKISELAGGVAAGDPREAQLPGYAEPSGLPEGGSREATRVERGITTEGIATSGERT